MNNKLYNISKFLISQRYILSSKRTFADKKKFYKNAGILCSDGKYEICLDQRKLKTPNRAPFIVDSEPLAIAISTEWNTQKDNIYPSTMHLTALCNTIIDNPNKLQKQDMINYIINYIQTDTILFQTNEENDLYELQSKEWDPVLEWFNKRYDTTIHKTRDITTPTISAGCKMNIGKFLNSYNTASLHGFTYAIDTLKSVILTFACVDRFILPDKAVALSRLEEEYQLGYWGRVEWAHDISQQELQARLSAAILFIYCNNSSAFIKEKLVI